MSNNESEDLEINNEIFVKGGLFMKKYYLFIIEKLRYILKLYESKNSELILLCHFYDTKEDTVFFASKYSLNKLKSIHKIFKMFNNISDAIDQLIAIFNESYPDNLSLKIKGFSFDVLQLSCSFKFLKNNKNDDIYFDLQNIGINIPNINEYIINEIYNIKEKRRKKYKEIELLKIQNRVNLERINELEKKIKNFLIYENNDNKINSNILINNDFEFLKNIFYKKYNINNVYFDLKYRATRDGEKASDFHKNCDNIPRTLILIKTIKGVTFGGFTEQTWSNEKEQKGDLKEDNNSFIFSLEKRQIYNIKPGQKAIWCHPQYGPCFYGKGSFCIYCKDYLLTEPLKTNKITENVFIGITNDYELTNGLDKAYCQEIEVFQTIMN